MIVISGILELDPSKIDLAVELTNTLCAATRDEPGNVTYEYWRDPNNAGRVRVFEEWESDDAINAHMASPHMADFLGAAGDIGITGVDISRYDVETKSKFM